MTTATIPTQLARDINIALSRLKMARTVDPRHELGNNPGHAGCDICSAERRLDWLLGLIQHRQTGTP
jgi:hypothetical protein